MPLILPVPKSLSEPVFICSLIFDTSNSLKFKDGKRFFLSKKGVYSIRIPAETRELMKEMGDIDWQEEIRAVVEDLVRQKRRENLLEKVKNLRDAMDPISASELLREDRDAR